MLSFGAKKMGRKVFAFLIAAWSVYACGLREIGVQKSDEDIWIGPGSIVVGGSDDIVVGKKVWYAVGVDFPEGYDWRTDDEKGQVKCSLVVFANGIPFMKVPVGDRYETSSDPDTHRMIEGSLYTDYSSDDETVVKRNGETIFRYPGREMIIEMAVRGDSVYTLGQSRDGNGFSYRVNGQVLLERESGYAFDHLQTCEDGLSFSFCEVIGTGSDAHERYYHYLAGEICQVAVREDIKKVWDIIFMNERVCYLASVVGITAPVLAVGSQMDPLEVPQGFEVRSCRFLPQAEDLSVEGVVFQRRKVLFSTLWKGVEMLHYFPSGYTVSSICGSGDGLSCVLNAPRAGVNGIIYRGGESFDMPEGYMSIGGDTMTIVDGILYLGLTSTAEERACVWAENEMKPLKINGFISHMSMN